MLNRAIVQRIHDLGGTCAGHAGSLAQAIDSLEFEQPLFKPDAIVDYVGTEAVQAFLDSSSNQRTSDPAGFVIAFAELVASNAHTFTFQVHLRYSPFSPGAWDDHGSKAQFRTVVRGDPLDFIQIAHWTGYPDHFFVCLGDPEPGNPTVYGTDHEPWFNDIHGYGTLERFSNHLRGASELLAEFEEAR